MHRVFRLPALVLLAGVTQWAAAQSAPPVSASPATPVSPGAAAPASPDAAAAPDVQTADPQPPDPQQPDLQTPAPPHGVVLFQSHGEPPESPATGSEAPPPTAGAGYSSSTSSSAAAPGVAPGAAAADLADAAKPSGPDVTGPEITGPELTDTDRAAATITAYDLDARLTPAKASVAVRAGLTLRNDGSEPLARMALQISSTLRWDSVSLLTSAGAQKLPVAQHLLDTDADHTGQANELVVELPAPLAPGETIRLDTFYSGAIGQNGARLARIGADATQAADADWDSAGPAEVALRGFGNVLWYPVSAPQVFLGQGNELFEAIGRMRVREASATVRLRLTIAFQGEPPVAAYFSGRRAALQAISDNADAPIAMNAGLATAEFAAEPMGYRALSLFVLPEKEQMAGPLPLGSETPPVPAAATATPEFSSSAPAVAAAVTSSAAASDPGEVAPAAAALSSGSGRAAGPDLLAVATANAARTAQLGDAVETVAPVLAEWFGAHPLSAVTVIDHAGQAFEDGPLVVAPAGALATPDQASALVYSLAHAWAQTGEPWIDEGLAGLATLLVTERQHGRDAATAQLNDLLRPLVIAEPEFSSEAAANAAGAPQGQPLIAATSEVYFRRKATAVFWMLRSLVGDEALRSAVRTLCAQPLSHATAREQAVAFEALLEKTSGKDLGWLFADWVLRDRGLPDLSFIDVTSRQLPAGQGHDSGWLVAVNVKNDGGATADVPVVIRSGSFSHTQRLRIAPFSQAVVRVLVESAPDQVVLNDGSVPEVRTPQHVRTLTAAPQ